MNGLHSAEVIFKGNRYVTANELGPFLKELEEELTLILDTRLNLRPSEPIKEFRLDIGDVTLEQLTAISNIISRINIKLHMNGFDFIEEWIWK
ncbi:hypothetical protein bpr_II045 (plasmid) [Butyrivibrio proteoclasticus B316]|uniref:Uncharacterized protein n=1 Tax=Butyrivibrio proteoclasticus (strain ATCC 51982 / DSM 14932 / B316) TaxID=515622 RepID=E0S3K3_BUTPB|nr:hypothetical protein [Butyrivibrio proteoclasticus]ADL35985.1 hypothetical protein bpr_II045 [Butyrivibrio proteoclasticus B316]